jgi:uncharacterized RDD family membrane protein YckC
VTAPAPGNPADSSYTVVPKEAREFQGERAGIVSRATANTIDFGVLVVALLGLWVGVQAVRFLLDPTGFSVWAPTFVRTVVAGGVLLFAYLWVAWATTGRTYGDHVMGLRVVNFRGQRMTWAGAALRSAFCVLFPIGLFWVAVSGANRSVQDVVLRSSVVYDWR